MAPQLCGRQKYLQSVVQFCFALFFKSPSPPVVDKNLIIPVHSCLPGPLGQRVDANRMCEVLSLRCTSMCSWPFLAPCPPLRVWVRDPTTRWPLAPMTSFCRASLRMHVRCRLSVGVTLKLEWRWMHRASLPSYMSTIFFSKFRNYCFLHQKTTILIEWFVLQQIFGVIHWNCRSLFRSLFLSSPPLSRKKIGLCFIFFLSLLLFFAKMHWSFPHQPSRGWLRH